MRICSDYELLECWGVPRKSAAFQKEVLPINVKSQNGFDDVKCQQNLLF